MAAKVITRHGFNVPAYQHETDWYPHKQETVIVPSTSLPGWGAYFTCDYKELDVIVHEITLQFNLGALSGASSTMLAPAFFFPTRIEIVQNSNVIDTIYGVEQFVKNNLYLEDEDRLLTNLMAGDYASTTQRTALASATQSYYYFPLWSYFKQGHIPLVDPSHYIQLRIYMDTLLDVVNAGTAPACTINAVNMLVKVTRLRAKEADEQRMDLLKRPQHFKFSECKWQTFTVNSGVSSCQLVLSGITGNISWLFFVVRTSGSTTGNNTVTYTAISQFAILDSASTNIVGGQAISNSESLLLLGRDWTTSSYLAETALGVTNNYANVYMYAFCSDPHANARHGVSSGSHKFTGNEQLQIYFVSSLSSNAQVDVYAYNDAVVQVSGKSVLKKDFKH